MNQIIFGRKGQGNWWWLLVVIVPIIMAMIFYIWQIATTGPGVPTTPEDYAKAWGSYGEAAFKPEDQPWRMLSIFFFPLLAYFSVFFAAVCIVFAQGNLHNWNLVQRPFIIFAFVISFIILPFPITTNLYQILAGISSLVPIVAWMIFIGMVILLFYYMRQHFGGGAGGGGGGGGGAGLGGLGGGQPGAAQPLAQAGINLNNYIVLINHQTDYLDNL